MANADVPLRRGWMGHIQGQGLDPTLIQMTIPGTHDTGTWKLEGSVSKCQAWPLRTQLDNGIRFIDIRLVPKSDATHPNDLKIYHGDKPAFSTDCEVWFSEVIADCKDFLRDNPDETVIMSIKNEHNNVSAAAFSTALDPFLVNTMDDAGDPLFRYDTVVPRLSDAKGRITVLRRYDYPPANTPGFAPPTEYHGLAPGIDGVTGWPDDNATTNPTSGFPPLMVQDVYGMSCTSKDKKWNDYIAPFLLQAEQGYPQAWFFNFTSASGGLPPTDFARDINSWLQTWLEAKLAEGDSVRLGTIPMDFPAQRSVDLLITINFAVEPGIVQAFRAYSLSIAGEQRGIGPAHKYASWNYAQATAANWIPHSLVKLSGNPDIGRIYQADVVMIHSTAFTNDEDTYLEGLGYNYEGSQLYYCTSAGYSYGATMVQWSVESPDPNRDPTKPIARGEKVMLRNLSTQYFKLANGYLYSQQGEDYLGTAALPTPGVPGDLLIEDFEWVVT